MSLTQCWTQPHWPEAIDDWLVEQLSQQAIVPTGSAEPVSGWALGHIRKRPTTMGDVFYKAIAFLLLFSNEATVCQQLSVNFPEFVPEVLATHAQQQWFATRSFGEALPEDAPQSDWETAFHHFAQLQLASIERIDTLKHHGCLARPIQQLPTQLSDALTSSAVQQRLEPSVSLNNQNIIEAVQSAITRLNGLKLPETLVHGDLHIENIARQDNNYLFFDWSDACISHPFIDGTYIFRMEDTPQKQAIIDSYLKPWQAWTTESTLKQAWALAEIVCYAHQAVSYASMANTLSVEEMASLNTACSNAFNRLNNAASCYR